MHLKQMPMKVLRAIAADVRKTIIGLIVVALIGGYAGLLALSQTVLETSSRILNIPIPLWGTISLVLLCALFTYITVRRKTPKKPPNVEKELHEAFGVYWNSQYKLRCLRCKWPLKCASKGLDPSIFWCSNCNTKFALRDPNGNPLTEANAIAGLKELLTSAPTRPDKAPAG
jgi:hypothetical protein